MKPDIVYIYSHQASRWRGQELKYSLRSLERYGRNYGKVYLVGDKAPYLNDKIIHIEKADDSTYAKERRIYEKLLLACQTKDISNPFIFFNDDFFLTKEIDLSKIGYYFNRSLEDKLNLMQTKGQYWRAMNNTREALISKGLPTTHFDIHYPMKYYKDKFIEIMTEYDWDIRCGYVIKSLYANTLKIRGIEREDRKIHHTHNKKEIREYVEASDIFSTNDITRAMAETLSHLYSEKCSYESF